jgi:hypothetical protein
MLRLAGNHPAVLVFMAASDDSAILIYEQGGVCNVVAFWFPEGGRDWEATVDDIHIPTDPAGLRSALVKGTLHAWRGSDEPLGRVPRSRFVRGASWVLFTANSVSTDHCYRSSLQDFFPNDLT